VDDSSGLTLFGFSVKRLARARQNDEDEEKGEGSRNEGCPFLKVISRSAQADFFVGRRNSITRPRCCGGSHFTLFENLIGM
jgi:hypothetical protein